MTKMIFAALALTIATAGAASANSQLAASLNVEPGVYTTAELIQLKDAREENDLTKIRFLEKRADLVTRGVAVSGPSQDAVIFAYENSLNGDSGNDENLGHFIAKMKGETTVSDETIAFAQAHLATVNEDND